ncbi:MAG: murein biosynthesis integral membrane protein MurJ [Armatimonadota bacterium]|nr:murein biosynthesis integral membrane protein MurJ [Armatimonadota bacterium]
MSTQKTVAKAAGLMMAAIFLSRVLGLIREMVIGHQFGMSNAVGAYVAAFRLPDFLYFFLSSGALSSAFIPVFAQYLADKKEKDAWQIFSAIACFMGICLSAAVILAEIFTRPLVIALAAPGFSPEWLDKTVSLTRIVLPAQLLFFLGGLMMGTLEARQRFTARALGPVIYNIGIIFGGVVLARWLHIAGLCWGALIGAFAGNIVMTYFSLRKAGYSFIPNLNLRHPGVVQVGKLALPVMLGLSLPQIDVMINGWFASFIGEQAVAALNYGNRLMQLPLGVFAQAGAVAFFPTLIAHANKKEMPEFRASLNLAMRGILFLTIPASVFIIVLATPIVRTVYQSGKFTADDAPIASAALLFYSAGIFAWAGQAVISRGFYALQETRVVVITGSIVTAIFIPMNYFLMKAMGISGLALSTSIAATLHMFALMILLRKRTEGLGTKRLAISVGKVCLASAVLGAVCWFAKSSIAGYADITTKSGAMKVVGVAFVPSIVVYLAVTWLLRSEEIGFFKTMLRSRLKRKEDAMELSEL